MTRKHKVFLSYHHENDQAYKDQFVKLFYQILVDWSVGDGDIDDNLSTETIRQKIRDEWLRDSTVTVVLIGAETWKRKHVDWEIGSSLRDTAKNPRSGLLGVLLPSYPRPAPGKYNPQTVPPRLWDNVQDPPAYANIYGWTESRQHMQDWIHTAFLRRTKEPPPNNSRVSFGQNRRGDSWQ